ncbi:MAG: RsmB/NOP family class I SAM-dependent RNA methyltransferase, partial [Candidatus Eremiobacteraeota bacterium]|nr:RsmB/NOP family class I SAM-dependent RNA methyltransferase [Candidatus Eremiobacteraeota bacterium]
NRARSTREAVSAWFEERGTTATPSALSEDAVRVGSAATARSGERESGGAWWVQSESSAMPVDVLNPQPGEAILDACSGRGNKALQSAARLDGEGSLVCIERDARKSSLLERRLNDAGFYAQILTADATSVDLTRQFDRILVDAPCSGLGVLGRHPEARWRKRPDDGERLAITQRALLDALAPKLNPGGVLVYAVCSTDPRETTEVIDWLTRTHDAQRGLMPERCEPFLTEAGDAIVPPGIDGRDGFFIARIERSA